ncbi:DUF2958 domain-containing protein [Ktedonospora formicarum]|uniref:DUF2958 domain-containing protein n=1 Tax=Ktedonospora formicarum TaxID=2778364 RepID=A0A8J3MTM6_9CHLR|nr:DUF2958 domain-containing protein [Ktedonospora formicarum]GHO44540.1 hypothetical protein KSX_27030 [Ktedonospora formicarum]
MSKLLPDSVRAQLPALYSQEHETDPIVYVKFVLPSSDWVWYGYEFDPEQCLFFGWVVGFEKEFGYFSLAELEHIKIPQKIQLIDPATEAVVDSFTHIIRVARDASFKPTRMSEVKQMHEEAEHLDN